MRHISEIGYYMRPQLFGNPEQLTVILDVELSYPSARLDGMTVDSPVGTEGR